MAKRWRHAAVVAELVAVAAASLSGQSKTSGACAANAKPANLDFTLKDLQGRDVTLSAHKGKVILLDFWATWSGPCTFEIPGFKALL